MSLSVSLITRQLSLSSSVSEDVGDHRLNSSAVEIWLFCRDSCETGMFSGGVSGTVVTCDSGSILVSEDSDGVLTLYEETKASKCLCRFVISHCPHMWNRVRNK